MTKHFTDTPLAQTTDTRVESAAITRRAWLGGAIALGSAAVVGTTARTRTARAAGSSTAGVFKLAPLPYDKDALAPYLSARTLEFHHGKHHQAYVDTTNKLMAENKMSATTLEEVIRATAGKAEQTALFNNASQAWNHAFYWRSLKPKGGGTPSGALAKRITADFGGYEAFRKEFIAAATGQFGSGWAWLIVDEGKLKIIKTSNADNPIAQGKKPLLTLDVWEHAYYLDYQNKRPDYVTTYLDHLAAWDFAELNLSEASKT